MPIYMLEGSYTAESWAAQLKNPQNRVESVGKVLCESAGGKLIGAWYCFGDQDIVLVADMPDNQSMAALSLAVTAGGAVESLKTTVLMTGEEAVAAMKKATSVTYKPAR
jgi:uncharacterized protein with GYD domain